MPSQETTWDQWFYVAAPFQIYLIIVTILVVYGDHGEERNPLKQLFRRISHSLERATGYPGWAMAGVLSGLLMLATAAIGVYWDVAYHIDFGRDEALMTPSHTMIVLGLGGLVYAAVIAVIFATLDDAPVGIRVGGLRVPWSAISMAALGTGGLISFPLDNLWHETYGIDVTLWSPSHLGLIAGGSLATISTWLMIRETRATPTLLGRTIQATALGAVLVGVTVVQGEFEFGVPQFQVLYLPILLAAAAGFGLVLARVAMGPWGALKAVAAYLVVRGVVSLLIAVPLNHTFPNFPLYLVGALAVEGVAYLLGTDNRLRFALVAGLAAGSVGVAADLIWLGLLADVDPSSSLLPKAALLAPLTAAATGLLGGALARPVPGATRRVPAAAALVGGTVLVGALLYPLPRNVGDVEAVIRLQPVGEQAAVEVDLQPPDAAKSATAFGIVSWQGGGRVSASLREVAPGRYVSSRPVPIRGDWKSMVGLQRGDQVMAAPIYLPADPEYGDPEIPALPERRTSFVRNTTLLLRETKSGPSGTAVAAYTGLGVSVLAWIVLFAVCAVKLSDPDNTSGPRWARPYSRPLPPVPTPPPPVPDRGVPEPAGAGRYGLDRSSIMAPVAEKTREPG